MCRSLWVFFFVCAILLGGAGSAVLPADASASPEESSQLEVGLDPISNHDADPELELESQQASDPDPLDIQDDDLTADELHLDSSVQSDGSAEWTIQFWVRLEDETTTDAFESFSEDVQNDPEGYTQAFGDRIRDTVATASDATNREMAVEDVRVETDRQSLTREYGVITYTFRWQGFAVVDDDRLIAGDAIEGLFFDDGTRLLVEWPEEYELDSAGPEPDERRENLVIWRGSETEFVSGEPRVVVSPTGSGGNTAMAVAAVAVVGVIGAAAWRYRLRRRGTGDAANSTTARDGTPAAACETPEDPPSEPTKKPVGAHAETGESTETGEGAGVGADHTRRDLLSNEEQVLRLLTERGGRVKQQTIVQELGWTDAKTSKVVGRLREQGALESFRLGRENVLTLPDDDDDKTI